MPSIFFKGILLLIDKQPATANKVLELSDRYDDS